MFSKKQFLTLLGISMVLFLVVFIVCYQYFYSSNDMVNPEAVMETAQTQSVETTPSEPLAVQEEVRILPSTRIFLAVKDQDQVVIEEKELNVEGFLNKTQQDVVAAFKDYKIEQFTKQEVKLVKTIYKEKTPPTYRLGIQGEAIGICVTGDQVAFIPLNLYVEDFSVRTCEQIRNKNIDITVEQKQKLQANPYYIEEILQSYSE